jgi:hypothetical protein
MRLVKWLVFGAAWSGAQGAQGLEDREAPIDSMDR